jgi:serine/threonine-protein kinase RsbW
MSVIKGKSVLYGLDSLDTKLDSIIDELGLEKYRFETKLILIEAVTNAFIHGNNRDISKPISISFNLEGSLLKIDVTDCGRGFNTLQVREDIDDKDILSESGRGLYLINCYTDEVEFKGSSIIMKKYVS